jgi:hypothetical protein
MSQDALRDLPVPQTKTAAMRYIAELVGHGYVRHQRGSVPAAKAVALVEKFDARYRVLASRGARDHARSSGRSVARLVMYPKDGDDAAWLFWLLGTEGEGLLAAESSTSDARTPGARITWGEQYELVARPVLRRGVGTRYVWTWVFSDHAYASWQSRLKTAAGRVRSSKEGKASFLDEQIEFIRRVPGFHGINRQKRALILGADLPAEQHTRLDLRRLGSVVDKRLAVFADGRTVRSLAPSV